MSQSGDQSRGSGGKRPVLPPPPPELAEDDQAARDAEREAQREAAAAEKARQDAARAKQEAADAKRAEREAKAADRQRARDERQAAKDARKRPTPADAPPQQPTAQQPTAQQPTAQQPAVPTGQATRGRGGPAPARRTRKAQLRLVQVDAWSVMKTSFLLSIALGIVLVVAVAIIWSVLGAAGVWDSINSVVQQAVGNATGPQFDITDYVGTSRVLGFAMLVAALDVVLITAIATLGAFLYNLSAALLGGIEVTLAEDS